jgi:hypothetical protein
VEEEGGVVMASHEEREEESTRRYPLGERKKDTAPPHSLPPLTQFDKFRSSKIRETPESNRQSTTEGVDAPLKEEKEECERER